ncbi:MAG: DUF523 domain-containing protein [Nitrososphaeria archaeon]|nr:DUF523 domain-containing protein [Nitrososphaeria archaeon]
MILCSACLLGIECNYRGGSNLNSRVLKLLDKNILIPVCPEQLGGLPTPRENAEIIGDGYMVLDGRGKVITFSGKDVTQYFVKGAKETLKIVKLYGIGSAIFKQYSPSCGSGKIYDGTFSKRLVSGDGVTAALLKRNGVKVFSEEDI